MTKLGLCLTIALAGLIARGDGSSGIRGQYWFDYGPARHDFAPGHIEIPTDNLADGLHTFNAYIEEDSVLSSTHCSWFLKRSGLFAENEELTCSFILDGQSYATQKARVGANGMVDINLDVTGVDLGLHTLGVMFTDDAGNTLGYRNGVFWRVPTDMQQSTLEAYYFLDGQYRGVIAPTANGTALHVDIDAAELETGFHSVTAYLASPHGMASEVRSAWFIKIPDGGEGVKQYSYWLNDDQATLSTVDLPEITNPCSVMALVDVPVLPFRSKSYTFAIEDKMPVLYGCNDFKIRFMDADARVTTASRTYTDVRVKEPQGNVPAIDTYGRTNTGAISANTVKLYRFEAEMGDSVNVHADRAAMLEVYSPTAETVIKASGADAVRNRTFTARENGTYYLAVHDVASGNSAAVDLNLIHRYALLEQNVTRSANRGSFEMNVKGNGFDALQSLKLAGNDTECIIDRYQVIDNYTLRAFINFDDKSLEKGDYRLIGCFVNEEDAATEEIVSKSTLTIEDATPVDINVEIKAPRIARTPYLAYINVTNSSNVGVWGIPFNIAAQHSKNGGTISFEDFEIVVDEKYKESIPVVHETADLLGTGKSGAFAPTIIPYLAPGESRTYTIGLTTKAHEIVQMYAWAGKPWSEEIREIRSDDYDFTVLQEPFDGNLFTFTEWCKLYYQLSSGNYADQTPAAARSMTTGSPTLADVANNAAGAAKLAVDAAASTSSNAINTRMAGRQMLLDMTGSNEYVEQMQNTDRGMLLVGNDLMGVGNTSNNLIGNLEALDHLVNARNHWQDAVPPHPNPGPNPIDCYQSGDPNDMKGYTAPSGSTYIGAEVKTVTYTIEFENDPEIANAPASTINVKSRVDASCFNLASFKPLSLKIGDKEIDLPSEHHFVKTLDMRTGINAIAELAFDFDATTGLAEWTLRSLDPLTLDDIEYMDDGILPVNDDSGRGTGYLTFAIDLLPTVADNTKIDSKADIVFDNNPAISTPVWTNITDYVMPASRIVSQTTEDNLTFNFTVEGTDNGSGIWLYDFYMRSGTSKTWTAVKTAIESDTFSYTLAEELVNVTFAVLATDRAGNRQSDAILDVVVGDADGNGQVDANDVVAVRNYYLGDSKELNVQNADVNADGITDTQDATAIINLYLDNSSAKSVKRLIIK